MEVLIFKSAEESSRYASKLMANVVTKKPKAVLGLATGSTPLPLYEELIRKHKSEDLDFSEVTTFNLDEYIGLKGDHPCSYRYFMKDNLFDHINVKEENIHIPCGITDDIPATCAAYEEDIKQAGGIDIQVLGLGSDGHIGFNEPTSSLSSRTRIKTLTQKTCEDNARFFKSLDDVPRHCITMGIGTIMESNEIILLAHGKAKAEAVKHLVEGPISAMWPATALQMHQHVKVLLDEDAASSLTQTDYYLWVANNKPTWQQP